MKKISGTEEFALTNESCFTEEFASTNESCFAEESAATNESSLEIEYLTHLCWNLYWSFASMKIIIVLLQVYFSFVVIVVMEFLSKSQIISPTGSTKKHWNENGWKKDGLDGSDGHHPENLMEMHMECMVT